MIYQCSVSGVGIKDERYIYFKEGVYKDPDSIKDNEHIPKIIFTEFGCYQAVTRMKILSEKHKCS
jgi:hypothetical protein